MLYVIALAQDAITCSRGWTAENKEHRGRIDMDLTRELHKLDGAHGLRVQVNGQKILCRGGYIQPELLFDRDANRICSVSAQMAHRGR